jgi:threonine dehydrogenase-like Zn-dependent dehydrogenase
VINAHERDPKRYVQGMENALQATLNGSMNYEPLLTHFMPLEKLGEALRLTQDRPDGFMKAVVKMD